MRGIGNEPAWLRGRLADRGASNSTIMLLLSILFFASGDCCCLDSVGSSASTSTLSSPLISQKSAQRAQLVRASPRATQNFVPADNRSQHWESGWNCIAHSLYASLRWRADQRLTFKLKMKKQFSFIGGKKSISINIFHMYRCSSVNVASRN